MRTIYATAAAWAVLLFTTAAPATAQNREHLQLAAELRMLQEQNQQLSLALTQLADTLKAVNARLDANEEFQRRRFADQEVLVKNLGSDLGTIRERTQDTDTRLRTLKDEIDALRQTFLTLPSLIAQSQMPAPLVDPNNPNAVPSSAPGGIAAAAPPPTSAPPILALPPEAGLSPNRLFETAFSDYTSAQYASAITGFQQLVKTYPTAERADDAQFFIGESLANMKRLPEAIDAYNQVIQKYPTGDQVDMALYRRGYMEVEIGRADAARATFEEVVKRFPNSQGAVLAKQRLAGLSRAPAPPAKP